MYVCMCLREFLVFVNFMAFIIMLCNGLFISCLPIAILEELVVTQVQLVSTCTCTHFASCVAVKVCNARQTVYFSLSGGDN